MTGASSDNDDFDIVDPRFAAYILANAVPEVLATGFRWIEGPVWMGDWNCLLFQDLPRDRTMRWSDGDGTSIWRAPSAYANGQARDRQGRLVFCSHLDRGVYRVEHDGSVTALATACAGRRLNSPNDIVVKSDGSIWFTDPVYGISNDFEGRRQASESPPAVYRLDPETGDLTIVSLAFDGPNGLGFSPDETLLYVSETGDQAQPGPRQVLRVCSIGDDGRSIAGTRDFHAVSAGYSDGMAIDEDGNVWSSAGDGVHCIDREGKLLGRIKLPGRVSNLCFGGSPQLNRLFICSSHTLFAVYLNCRGARWPDKS